MSDLISTQESVTKIVDTAIRKILSGEQKLTKEYEQSVIEAVNVILDTARRERGKAEAQPEIIRCKNCKYGGCEPARPNKYHPCDSAFPAHWRCYYYKQFIPIVSEDGFCSFAERRTDE